MFAARLPLQVQPVRIQLQREIHDPFWNNAPERKLAALSAERQFGSDRVLVMKPATSMRAAAGSSPELVHYGT
jgi:hypothetical protein